ncbi:DUF5985 family protein [Candidatus Manganitrophus noduliformans]|uniref:Uncharacterized protein n=1 Tax=Candidatus Manganitrophus noduliformans TaxID=2606439 RepID=A0A7X6DLS9_9BACT|nr:DUF5985 family protein [Candidatus Manganitrophus noduliformans]NKE69467.1 hypothetical protein [Candidatus Manganitrophus noduliformans]
MIEGAVYFLCALTSVACAFILLRSYQRNRTGILLWSALCFVGLALNNILLFVDLLFPQVPLQLWRLLPALVGLMLLIYGLIWDLV